MRESVVDEMGRRLAMEDASEIRGLANAAVTHKMVVTTNKWLLSVMLVVDGVVYESELAHCAISVESTSSQILIAFIVLD